MRVLNLVMTCLLGLALFWEPGCLCKAQAQASDSDIELEGFQPGEIRLTSPGLLSRNIYKRASGPELDSEWQRKLYSLKAGRPSLRSDSDTEAVTSEVTPTSASLLGPVNAKTLSTSMSETLLGPANGHPPDSSMSAKLLAPENGKALDTSISALLLGLADGNAPESSVSATLLGLANGKAPDFSMAAKLLEPANGRAPEPSMSVKLLGAANAKASDLSMSAKLLGPANGKDSSMSANLLGPANRKALEQSMSGTLLGPANGKALHLSMSAKLLGPANTKVSGTETHHQVIDHDGNVHLTWHLDFVKETITFEMVAWTLGYVGFGLNAGSGGMDGADIVIGGVYSNGNPYFADYHGTGNQMPVLDQHQSWRFESVAKNVSHTTLKFSRALDTCDSEDVPINNDTLNLIWAFGSSNRDSDLINYHMDRRGTVAINLLDPPYPNLDPDRVPTFELSVDMFMPPNAFTYWCTAHPAPAQFKGKAHIVGFKPKLYGPIAIRHTHHFVLYKCNDDASAALEVKVKGKGEDCYGAPALPTPPPARSGNQTTQPVVPMNFMCPTTLYVWGAGGEPLMLPEHVGYPIGLSPNEYFMLEVHFDNPTQKEGVKFRAGVEILYSKELRKHDAGMMTIGHTTMASLLIPPMTANWKIHGHCSSECTKEFLPTTGIQIINAMMHSHLAGRKMKFRHFRGNEELPWISYDDHYHFNYQKNRPIRNERTILPGDQLTFECVYDSYGRANVTVGGFSTANEMCETFIWYYPAIPNAISCTSFIPPELVFDKFGIQKTKPPNGFATVNDPTMLEPPTLTGKTFTEVLNTQVPWTKGLVEELQGMLLTAPQIAMCPGPGRKSVTAIGKVVVSSPPPSQTPMPVKPILVNNPFLNKLYQPTPTCTQVNDKQLLLFYGDGHVPQINQMQAPQPYSTEETTSTSTSTSTSTEASTTSTSTEAVTMSSTTATTTFTTTAEEYSTTEISTSSTERDVTSASTPKMTMTTTIETIEQESTTPRRGGGSKHRNRTRHHSKGSKKSGAAGSVTVVKMSYHAHAYACGLALALFVRVLSQV